MRGEVLSSVELVLPPAVVKTCYNIKRDGQARFRAVNNEEKTKSEITVEKQEDDSVKIQVIVLSLTCLTDEEIGEEISFEATDKENARGPVSKGRRGPRRRKRLGFARKLKSAGKKSPLKVKPNKETLHSVEAEPPLDNSTGLGNEAKSTDCEVGNQKEEESHILPIEETDQGKKGEENTQEKERPTVGAVTKRGGRRFSRRGRGGGVRRNVTKLARQKPSQLDDLPKQINDHIEANDKQESVDSVANESSNCTKGPDGSKSEDAIVTDTAIVSDDTAVVVTEFSHNSETIQRRGKRVRRNTDRSSQGDTDQESNCVKSVRPRRKLVKSVEEDIDAAECASPSGRTRRKSSLSSLENKEVTPVNTKVNKGPSRDSLRKRKAAALPDTSDLGDPSQEGATPTNQSEETCQKNTQSDQEHNNSLGLSSEKGEQISPRVNKKSKAAKNSAKVKRIANTKSINSVEEPHKAKDDDVSIQSQITEIVQAQNFDKSTKDVKAKVGKRRGRQPVFSESAEGIGQHEQELTQPELPPVDPVLPPPPPRVKTKAQLKQKPVELVDSDDIESFSDKKLKETDSTNTSQQSSYFKQSGKKPPQKPKTLARIWRTRKKSGFTHRKKSKPKPGKESFIVQNEKDSEVEETEKNITESTEDVGQNEGQSDSLKTDQHESDVKLDCAELEKPSTINREGKKETGAAAESVSLLVSPERIENLKLPQKKRHTAKLAAERQKAAADQANATSETLVADNNIPSGSVSVDVTLDLANTCTDFNETSAIESLIQLSNATEEPYNGPTLGGVQYVGLSSPDHVPPSVNGVAGPSPPPGPQPEGRREEVTSTVESISQMETETAIENINHVPVASPQDVIQEMMKLATGSKAEAGETDDLQNRQGKRAYKREFKVQCRFCQVKVKDYGYLFRHVKKLHRDKGTEMQKHLEEIRPLMRTPCPICHKMVSSISNISSHIKQCHASKDSAVLCPICKKTYKTTVSLRQHLRQCHQPQQHRFFCHLCDANFTEKRSLKEHINCSHETTQVFHCDECGKSFLTKGRLRRHKYIHGDFRHKCNYCGKGFHLKDNMNKHIEIVHEKTQGKRFECPHCEKKFTVKGNMTQHVMGVHLKQFQYTCPQCQTGFRRKKDMLSHMLKHGESGSTAQTPYAGLNGDEEEDEEEEEDTTCSELEEKRAESPWHGRGEKTEVITGLASDSSSSEGSQAQRKTEVIVISPIPGYPSP